MKTRLWTTTDGGAFFWVFADTPQQADKLLRETGDWIDPDVGIFRWTSLAANDEFTYFFDDGTRAKLTAGQWCELFHKQSLVLATSEW